MFNMRGGGERMTDGDERQQQILSAAEAVIIRQGYDKTTMSDIADEAGVSRGTVYLYFENKDSLFEALIARELRQYVATWLEHIEADPRGGTIGGIYRAVLYAIDSRPLMAAMMRRDRRVVGSYLRRPDNAFAAMESNAVGAGFLRALQAAGAVRADVDPDVASHVLDMLSYGLVTIGDFKSADQLPPFDAVMEMVADMLDRLLTPPDGGDNEAGKAVIRQLAAASRAQLDQTLKQTKA
ncbi:MAG: TetR/AcrR family transcriptional regulator [Anaerolineae bacterium]|nr:TetR/AcrR family transcriptional regulator [Anaerolineae bacterium]